MSNRNDDIRKTFERLRKALNESETEKQGGIPYTQQDELLQTTMQTAKEQFGGDFTDIKTPMFYYRQDGDVTFSCVIPSLNNSKVQFRYKDPSGEGCYIWCEGVQLTDNNSRTIEKIRDAFLNWKQSLVEDGDLLDKLHKEANKE